MLVWRQGQCDIKITSIRHKGNRQHCTTSVHVIHLGHFDIKKQKTQRQSTDCTVIHQGYCDIKITSTKHKRSQQTASHVILQGYCITLHQNNIHQTQRQLTKCTACHPPWFLCHKTSQQTALPQGSLCFTCMHQNTGTSHQTGIGQRHAVKMCCFISIQRSSYQPSDTAFHN